MDILYLVIVFNVVLVNGKLIYIYTLILYITVNCQLYNKNVDIQFSVHYVFLV
jgi:hypothetical protein